MRLSVVFDLDGTLIHSTPDIQAAVNRMLAGEGAEPLDLATVTSFVGNGLPKLVERVIAARGLAVQDHKRLTSVTLELYEAAPADLTHPYPGVVAALRALAAAGHPMGLCTNKPEAAVRAILRALGLAEFFTSVVGGDRLATIKPDPAMLHLSVAELGGGPAVFVGDSEVDAATAEAARLPFALYTEGYRKSPVSALPHDVAFADFADLPGLVAKLANGASESLPKK